MKQNAAENPSSPEDGLFGVGVPPEEAELVLIPVPFDATASYRRRASLGPEAIFNASPQLDLYDPEDPAAYERGIAWLSDTSTPAQLNQKARQAVDRAREGDDQAVVEVNQLSAELNRWVATETRKWLSQGKRVGLVGGDHSTPFGCIQEHLRHYRTLGVLHIDAHADLRVAYEGFTWSHASIMHNVLEHTELTRLVQVGVRDYAASEAKRIESDARVSTFFMDGLRREQFHGTTWAEQVARIVDSLPPEVYVSFDIDGLDPVYCPGTGTPVPGGLTWHEAVYLLRAVVRSRRRVVGFDLNEVAPGPNSDEYDAIVGARMLYQLCLASLRG